MSQIAIKVENLSKQYRLGTVGTGTISHDINRWWHRVRGKEDPYLKIGETNDRASKGSSEYVWALQDINFEVQQGEVLGIIGRNGAGKSTLLKILSRTTAPTTGSIKIKGRVASLLEVGTGFHPELTGRENIYLNGAILGMSKAEISRKFDEIVDFAGVERYVDTPVKRYSSGMYVRLAFAVAAHLEPEILIVDEVLAVGDLDFQKKCIKKMKSVSVEENRTIIFVSHDMKAIDNLCNTSLYLKNGTLLNIGKTSDIIRKYVLSHTLGYGKIQINKKKVEFEKILNLGELSDINISSDLVIKVLLTSNNYSSDNLYIDFGIYNERNEMVIHSKSKYTGSSFCIGKNKSVIVNYIAIKPNLAPGNYTLTIFIYEESLDKEILYWIDELPLCTVSSTNVHLHESDYLEEVKSIIFPQTQIIITDAH